MAYELNDRLINILVHLADGKSTKEIAKLTSFSERTVKTDISKLHATFGVHTRAALVAKALREEVIE